MQFETKAVALNIAGATTLQGYPSVLTNCAAQMVDRN